MTAPPPEIAAIRATARSVSYSLRELLKQHRLADDVDALAAELERVTAERNEARAWRDLAEKSRAWFENALEAAEAERDRLREALEEIADGFASTNLPVQSEMQAIAAAALAGGTDAAPPEQKP